MERHDRERRKEEERLLREKQREEERYQREQRRELERREKFLQKESIRVSLVVLTGILFPYLSCQIYDHYLYCTFRLRK